MGDAKMRPSSSTSIPSFTWISVAAWVGCAAPKPAGSAAEPSDGADGGGAADGALDDGANDGGGGADGGAADGSTADGGDSAAPDRPPGDHCSVLDGFSPVFDAEVATFAAQDDRSAGPDRPLVFVGSSSIRRWEGLTAAYPDQQPRQRGIGGAELAEIALQADTLVNRHGPRGVVVFAGTNDVAAGVPTDTVVDRLLCLRERIWLANGGALPVFFIGITPNPSRWEGWPDAAAVNAAVEALAASDPGLVYVDVPSAFLATGFPPDSALFVGDGLHLSEAGYALWDSVLRPAIDAKLPPDPPMVVPEGAPRPGARLLIDLGPDNPEDGERTADPDYLGQRWNNWHPLEGGLGVLPGQHLDGLVTDEGVLTGVDLVVTGGFFGNGRSNGGLLWPSSDLLGALAVGSATGDFFYSEPEDQSGGLQLRGLDPNGTYRLRLFGSRDEAELRITTYIVSGADRTEATLQTSGPGAGADGTTGNNDTIVDLAGLRPDAWGNLYVDLRVTAGTFAYLSLIELSAE